MSVPTSHVVSVISSFDVSNPVRRDRIDLREMETTCGRAVALTDRWRPALWAPEVVLPPPSAVAAAAVGVHRFPVPEVITVAVRWYLRYGLS